MFELRLTFADERIVAFDKPSGLAVHRGWAKDDVTAVDLAHRAVGAVWPVHRLDRGTSGVLVFARNAGVARELHEAFENGLVKKTYVALVRGEPRDAVVDHPIPRREGGPRVPAITEVRLLWAGDVTWRDPSANDPRLRERTRYALVEARPHGGRLHQVRRHLKHLGHPVIGDANYGRGEHNRALAREIDLHRLALHALTMAIPIDASGPSLDALRFTASLPEDLASPLTRLGVPADLLRELSTPP